MLLNTINRVFVDEKLISYARFINLQDKKKLPKFVLEITLTNKDFFQVEYATIADLNNDLKIINMRCNK